MAQTVRLIVSKAADGGLEINSAERVDMDAPAGSATGKTDPLLESAGREPMGRFLEMRSENNDLLQSHPIDALMHDHVEFPTGDPDQPFGRVEAPPGTVYSILVPDDPQTRRLNIVEVEPFSPSVFEAVEIAPVGGRRLQRRSLASIQLN
jgi:hypothetical protein